MVKNRERESSPGPVHIETKHVAGDSLVSGAVKMALGPFGALVISGAHEEAMVVMPDGTIARSRQYRVSNAIKLGKATIDSERR